MKALFRSSRPQAAVACAAAALAAGGIAYGSIPASDGTVRACYAKKDGLLLGIPYSKGDVRVVDEGTGCRAYEAPLAWNQQGVPGAPGAPGAQGPPGPSDAFTVRQDPNTLVHMTGAPVDVLTLAVPAGEYVLNAKASVGSSGASGLQFTDCQLFADATKADASTAEFEAPGEETLALQGTATGPATVRLTCFGGSGLIARVAALTAVRVGQLHG
jgi:hypothetical protein